MREFKTNLEKASFMLTSQDIFCEEVGGRIYVNLSESLSVAIHDEEIHYLAERYDEEVCKA